MLFFKGREQVHGIFDYLLNELMKGDDAGVPTLLAPVPFLHGALIMPRPKVLFVRVDTIRGRCCVDLVDDTV